MTLSDEAWIAEARRQFAATGTWDIPITPPPAPPAAAAAERLPCPNCGRELERFRRYDIASTEPLRWCPNCYGFWARGDALATGVVGSSDDREALYAAEAAPRCRQCERGGRLNANGVCRRCGWTRPALACPACSTPMARERVKGVELDACGACRATWFDIGEIRRMYGLVRPQSMASSTVDETAGPSDTDLALGAAQILLGAFFRLPLPF